MYIIVTTNEKLVKNAKLVGAEVFEASNNKSEIGINKNAEEDNISELLQAFTITPELNGYHYLKSMLRRCIIDKNYCRSSMMQRIYLDVAKQFNVTVACVERTIRHAISKSFDTVPEAYELLYARKLTKAPTNKSFICMISELINYSD